MLSFNHYILAPLPAPERAVALFFDIDGTLALLADTPAEARIPKNTLVLLGELQRQTQGALALISGRTLAGIDRMCAPYTFCAAGQHGLEMRQRAALEIHVHKEAIASLKHAEREIRDFHRQYPGLLVEYKGMSIAVHYRRLPALEREVRDLIQCLAKREACYLRVQEGKMVAELRVIGMTKGDVIRWWMDTPPFAGRLPIFAGDDLTDEEGFAAVNALGGISMKVGAGKTAARYRMADVAALQHWLSELHAYFQTPLIAM